MKRSTRLRDVPVLLLTGAFEPLDDDKARQSACDGVLVKPFEPQHLVSRVVELLARQRQAATEEPADAAPVSAAEPALAAVPTAAPAAASLPAADLAEDSYQPDEPALPAVSGEPSERTPLHLVEPSQPPAVQEPIDLAAFSTDIAELDAALELVGSSSSQESIDPPLEIDELQWNAPVLTEPDSAVELAETVLEPLAPMSSLSTESWDLAAPFQPADAPHDEAPAVEAAAFVPPPASVPAPSQAMPPVSLASAFAALLAAEQAHPGGANPSAGSGMTEAAIEDIVRRVLTRVTDEMVRQVVLDAAERMVKAEIDKIKDAPEDQD
jgi:CheY-like chemotaxis protein